MKKITAAILTILLVLSLGACALLTPQHPTTVFENEEHYANLFEEIDPSVVAIESYIIEAKSSLGSGTIFKVEQLETTYRYYVVTNHHVVDGATHVLVYLTENYFVRGDIYATSNKDSLGNFLASEDVAIVRFDFEHKIRVQPIIPFENPNVSVAVKTGHQVFAIGTPVSLNYYNLLSNIATISKVSTKWIIHGANINPGNSGGPLFSTDGTYIGMNTQRLEKTPSSDRDVVLIGEAIHVNQVAAVLHQLFDSITPKFGINIMNSHPVGEAGGFINLPEAAYGFDPLTKINPEIHGVVVIDVATTLPAAKKLELFDLIVKVDGQDVTTIDELMAVVGTITKDKTYTFEVVRKVNEEFVPVVVEIKI